MDSSLSFRKATVADAQAIRSLVISAFRGDSSRAGWTTEADLVADERISEEGLLDKIQQPNGKVVMAHDRAGALVGCAEIVRDKDVVRIGMGAVDPLCQAQGIGKASISYLESIARDEYLASRIEIYVIWTRKELIDFYMRLGYSKTGRVVPFPYGELVNGKALRDDLYFDVLGKTLDAKSVARL
ncbi:hypothetical protein G3M48_001118 [Beauveria asiatica]|uniref:N-acetyltransferase domain-containing protein n=1 Tax=Beauveria asiatica TaxID=1069075 RepID=A0AAW0S894_9HYPO